MADTIQVSDQQAQRMQAFSAAHGIPLQSYASAVQACVTFTRGATEDLVLARWSSYGARNIGGRVRALAQHPGNALVLYAGTAAGGVFRSGDAGDTWQPIGGPFAALCVGALAIAPSDPSVLYVGSGEPVIGRGYPAGQGLFRWRDGSAPTAALVGPASGSGGAQPGASDVCASIAVDPRNAQRAWFATETGLWRLEPDGRFVAEPVVNNAPVAGAAVTDVLALDNADPDHPERVRLYVAVAGVGVFRGEFRRDTNPPRTEWTQRLGEGVFPAAGATSTWDRIRLAACTSQPQHVYAVAENRSDGSILGIWHSDDAGKTWRKRALPVVADASVTLGFIAWYALAIAVHPLNPGLLVFGSMNIFRSLNFGQSWDTILDWLEYDRGDHAQHSDQHVALFDAADPKKLWIANDGGISLALDVVQRQPLTDRGWRKRSHGITAAMFNDITVHPTYPQMMGGGLQDNGTYLSFGGESWYSAFGGDGGQMCFEVGDPRQFVLGFQGGPAAGTLSPNYFGLWVSTVAAATPVMGNGARAPNNPDRPAPQDVFQVNALVIESNMLPAHPALFVPVIEHHPSAPGILLAGRASGGAYASSNLGASWALAGFTAGDFGGGDTSALAFGNAAGANADWWVGTTQGKVLRGVNAPPATTAWTATAPAGTDHTITRIAVHPNDDQCVAVATAQANAGQGRVFLTLDAGANWADITGLAVVAGPPAPPGGAALSALPPGSVAALAFDPQPAAGAAQVLYAGTLAGVYVIRNLPPLRSPAAAGVVPGFAPLWRRFIGVPTGLADSLAALPALLVEDLKVVRLPARSGPGVVAGAAETVARTRLMAATFGRGMFACDITAAQAPGVPAGGPAQRLYIRQTVVEDGLAYPRPSPATLNTPQPLPPAVPLADQYGGDPRLPAGVAPFTDHEAFDIRVDNAPLRFFEDVLDGVEFDENLSTRAVAAGELNVVYVQVHSAGWQAVNLAMVHLYFAPAPVPGPVPLPDLHADFWAHFEADPLPAPAATPAGGAAAWQRAGAMQLLTTVGPNQPAVARFEWLAPAALGGQVALLALVNTVAGVDPLDSTTAPTTLATLLRNERRAALRVAPVQPFVPDLFIRDGLDDIGRLAGVAFGGRSPDIIVLENAPDDPEAEFADSTADRSADRVRGGGGANVVYVRVHNRKAVETAADVELFWAVPNALLSATPGQAGPIFDASHWQVVAAVDAVNVPVPASGTRLARFDFNLAPAAAPGLPNAVAFIALVRSHDGQDPQPQRAGVDTQQEFWRLFSQLSNANNAALRALRYA